MTPKGRADQRSRAAQAWSILIDQAKKGQTMTYGQLAEKMKVRPMVCRFFLGLIQDHCIKEKLPPLQSLVINMKTKVPGEGYRATSRDRECIEKANLTVFEFKWDNQRNPFC